MTLDLITDINLIKTFTMFDRARIILVAILLSVQEVHVDLVKLNSSDTQCHVFNLY